MTQDPTKILTPEGWTPGQLAQIVAYLEADAAAKYAAAKEAAEADLYDHASRYQTQARYAQDLRDKIAGIVAPKAGEAPLLTPAEEALKAVLHSPAGAMAWLQERDAETYELIRRVTGAEVEAHKMGRDPR